MMVMSRERANFERGVMRIEESIERRREMGMGKEGIYLFRPDDDGRIERKSKLVSQNFI